MFLILSFDFEFNLITGPQTWYISSISAQDDNNVSTTNAQLLEIFQQPSSDVVGGLFFEFEAVRFATVSVPRRASPRRPGHAGDAGRGSRPKHL